MYVINALRLDEDDRTHGAGAHTTGEHYVHFVGKALFLDVGINEILRVLAFAGYASAAAAYVYRMLVFAHFGVIPFGNQFKIVNVVYSHFTHLCTGQGCRGYPPVLPA